MENPDLPQEILLEIFAKLPTKSVGKCRTLSVYWKTHLSTPNFIKKHFIHRKQTIQQENLALVPQVPFEQLYVVTSPTKKDEVSDYGSFPDEYFTVLGSCDGLVLLNVPDNWMLVNPITRKQVTVQPPLLSPEPSYLGYCTSVYGFGHDSCSDDYKLVQICNYKSNNDVLLKTLVDVYSFKNGVWKSLDDGCYPYHGFVPRRYAFEGGAFVNGALHWLVCSEEGYRSCIAAFDLAIEVFSEIPLPKEFVRQPGSVVECFTRVGFNMQRSYGVCAVGGCLLIVDNFGNGVTEVWIMKEYGVAESWVKFRIQAEDGNWHSIFAVLCYVEDEELLFLTSWEYLFALDLKKGTLRKVVLGGYDAWFAHGMAFVDSLVSPETVARY